MTKATWDYPTQEVREGRGREKSTGQHCGIVRSPETSWQSFNPFSSLRSPNLATPIRVSTSDPSRGMRRVGHHLLPAFAWYSNPRSASKDIAPVISAANASRPPDFVTNRMSSAESSTRTREKRDRPTCNIVLTHASFQPGDGPKPRGKKWYAPMTPVTGRRTPKKRQQNGATNRHRKQFCRLILPLCAPGERWLKNSTLVPNCTEEFPKTEISGNIAFDQSRATRTSSSLAIRCDGHTRRSGEHEPSLYQ